MAPHMVSRWAPASEPPTIARGSCQVCARSTQSSSDSPMGGRSPVRRPSATTTSSSASKGVLATRHVPPRRHCGPRAPAFSGANVSSKMRRSHTARCRRIPASSDCAPASSRRRVVGVRQRRHALGTRSANTSRHPGRPSRMAPCSKLSRSCMVWGSVSASTVAPRAAAAAAGGQLAPGALGVHGRDAEHVPVDRAVRQQRHGREEVDLLLGEAVEAAGHDELDGGALVLAHGGGQALHLRPGRRRATGTGWPSPSLWVCTCEVEKPSAPSARAACSAASMASMSSAVAAPPTARSPMTSRRSVEWPTRKPALTAMRPSRRPSHSPKERPVPGQARLQRGQRHALDPRHHPRDVVDVLRRHGRQGEAAVAAEHGGHAVQRRRAGVGVPEELGVVVGVQVDEAGGDQHAGGVDHRVGRRAGIGPDARRRARPR